MTSFEVVAIVLFIFLGFGIAMGMLIVSALGRRRGYLESDDEDEPPPRQDDDNVWPLRRPDGELPPKTACRSLGAGRRAGSQP
jgi:hypothetical protein